MPYHAFLSYNGADRPLIELVARHLTDAGLRVFFDRWYLTPGSNWVEQLEARMRDCTVAAVFVGPTGLGRWQQREQALALDLQARDGAFRVIPVILPGADPPLGFLSLNTWVDLRDASEPDFAARVERAIRGTGHGPGGPEDVATQSTICPYRGLRVFREEDGPFFFGRDAFVARLESALASQSLVAAVGASGVGKSSVIRAGLLPRLRTRHRSAWEILTIVPTDRPLHSLAAALLSVLEPDMSELERLRTTAELASDLASSRLQLRDVVARIIEKQPGTARLLLVIDQWEELYTLTKDDKVRQQLIAQVLESTEATPLSVVLTLRGDFYDRVAEHRLLSDRVEKATVNVSRMTREELQLAIEKPAEKTGLAFEAGLARRLLDACEDQPGSLPLLEFVLMELWKRRDGGVLTHEAYERIGELKGAIAAHAESVFTQLSEQEQDAARRMFLQLVRPGQTAESGGEDREPTRRRTTFDEIGEPNIPAVRKLADAHLVVTSRDEASGTEIIDLVHEALIKAWRRLQAWVEHERSFLLFRERLRTLMTLSSPRRATFLPAAVVRDAAGFLRSHISVLSTSEQRYIESAVAGHRIKRGLQSAMGIGVLLLIAFTAWRGARPPAEARPASSPAAPAGASLSGVLTIRTVVHVVYRTDEENISDEQIRSQFVVLNQDFRARNPDLRDVPQVFKDLSADPEIEFVLASSDPFGDPTTGITRTKTSVAAFEADDSVKHAQRGGADAWPGYLNIWVATLGQGLLEYSQFPGGPGRTEGIVVTSKGFGTLGTAAAPFNRGRSATHSLGHWLNLKHIWGDDPGCNGTDGIDDTPNQAGPSFGTPTFPHVSCGNGPNGDMFMNFMDYTDDNAMRMFTKGQVAAMRAAFDEPRRQATILRGQ